MDVAAIIQGGAVGVAVMALMILYQFWGKYVGITERVMDVVSRNAESNAALKASIEANTAASKDMQQMVNERLLKDFQALQQRQRGRDV